MDQKKKVEQEGLFTREQIASKFIEFLRAEAQRQLEGAEKSFKVSAEMDGKMQSRYDTQKEDHAAEGNMKLAAGQKLIRKIELYLEKSKPSTDTEAETQPVIGQGAVFKIKDLVYGGEEWFFLSDMAGGYSITIEDEKVQGLNPETPLGAFAIGKQVGQTIQYEVHGEMQKFRVIDVI